jgi:hypothetical protein
MYDRKFRQTRHLIRLASTHIPRAVSCALPAPKPRQNPARTPEPSIVSQVLLSFYQCDELTIRWQRGYLVLHFLPLSAVDIAIPTRRFPPFPRLPIDGTMARVYAEVNQHMPRAYWDYDSVNIGWGVLENYEVVRKIGKLRRLELPSNPSTTNANLPFSFCRKVAARREHQIAATSPPASAAEGNIKGSQAR